VISRVRPLRWVNKNWVEKTDRNMQRLKLQIAAEERYQQRRFFSEQSAADIELLETNCLKTEQQLNAIEGSLRGLYGGNCKALIKTDRVQRSAAKLKAEVQETERKLLERRRQIHEKDAMKYSLEMRNQSLVRHVLDVEEANQISARKIGLQTFPTLDVKA